MKEREEHRTLDLDGQARERLVLWIRRRMDEFGITLEALEEALIADAAVPWRCTEYSETSTMMVSGTTNCASAGAATSRPSIAPSTEMAGVITLSP